VITAVDSNVLIDVFAADPTFGPRSREALRACRREGSLIASDVVWAEVSAAFPSPDVAAEALDRLGIEFSPVGRAAALAAGGAWRAYRGRGGKRSESSPTLSWARTRAFTPSGF
jgi:predicted nucleic acid-binding protein